LSCLFLAVVTPLKQTSRPWWWFWATPQGAPYESVCIFHLSPRRPFPFPHPCCITNVSLVRERTPAVFGQASSSTAPSTKDPTTTAHPYVIPFFRSFHVPRTSGIYGGVFFYYSLSPPPSCCFLFVFSPAIRGPRREDPPLSGGGPFPVTSHAKPVITPLVGVVFLLRVLVAFQTPFAFPPSPSYRFSSPPLYDCPFDLPTPPVRLVFLGGSPSIFSPLSLGPEPNHLFVFPLFQQQGFPSGLSPFSFLHTEPPPPPKVSPPPRFDVSHFTLFPFLFTQVNGPCQSCLWFLLRA